MRYKGLDLPLSRIGAELGVATVVTGSVRRSGGRVRVVASMLDTRTEDHLWAESYDRDLEDIFEVQSEIAARVAEAVRRELTVADRRRILGRGTDNGEAYDLYLRGRHLWEQRTEAAVSEAIRFLQEALELDPRFSLAHAALADAYTVLGIYGMRRPGIVLEAAMRSARAALELEPELGEAHAALACVRGVYDWAWASAETGFQRAITLSPSYATAYQWYASNLLVPLGRKEEAKEQLRRAKELDPVSGAITASEGIAAFYAREWATARATFEDLVRAMPRLTLAHLFLGQCLEFMGDSPGAIEALGHAVALSGESSEALAALAHAKASAGRSQDAERILGRLEARAEHAYVSPALLAQVLLGLGRADEALDRLDEAAGGRASDLIWLAVRPAYDPIRSSERFRAIVQRVGLDGAT